ncbi:hypothetical protein [Daejeonella oryzae]|uniref:hypothetical protein n=1 Tax=Daejeonella oryzae TaxID=1122943 RepID=UPI0006859B19|nr:hypothetical protein [Daejeonella oryzae]
MKPLFLILTGLTVTLNACNSTTVKYAEENADSIKSSICYSYDNKKDLINIQMNDSAGFVIGNLNYNIYEKDKNTGIIKGKMRGDTLIADYTFMSEGTESVRQVAFLKKGTDLLEGFTEVEEKNGQMVFKEIDSLKFGAIILKPAACKD